MYQKINFMTSSHNQFIMVWELSAIVKYHEVPDSEFSPDMSETEEKLVC